MKIEYLLHAPRTGEPYGTIFVRAYDRSNRDRLFDLLDDQASYIGAWPMTGNNGWIWWEVPVEKWNATLAVLAFSGGTEVFTT